MLDLVISSEQMEYSAEWRRLKAEEFPWDAERNLKAATALDRIAMDLLSLNGSYLHQKASELLADDSETFCRLWSELANDIGFHAFVDTGIEFMRSVIQRTEQETATRESCLAY